MNGIQGLQGWRWLFILEGIPSCICAALCFFFFPDFPETASWLSDAERQLATERIKGVAALGHAKITWAEAKETLLDWRIYLHYIAYIGMSPPFSSLTLFTPTLVAGLGYEGLDAQLFTVPPFAASFVVTVIVAWIADKRALRAWCSFSCLFTAGVAFLIQGALVYTFQRAVELMVKQELYRHIHSRLAMVSYVSLLPSLSQARRRKLVGWLRTCGTLAH